ncbi:hypothetical protein [Halomicrococcus sp. NG-SE-24]|uniref:hypothetical protein n=1 Tax=Halomicrococcus sp. NG-SE-24 TaxID=3436928 RepID=UPI003D980045
MSQLDVVIEDNRFNSIVTWLLVAVLLLAAAVSVISGEPIWAVFVAGGLVIILLPAGVRRNRSVMPPWEIVVFTALPITSQFFALPDMLADLTTFLAILAIGVLVVVELHVFSPVEMTPRFAVAFVIFVTMATAGVWAILQYASDVYFNTTLIQNKTTLMWDLVFATAISFVASPIFAIYFRWIEAVDVRGLTAGEGL